MSSIPVSRVDGQAPGLGHEAGGRAQTGDAAVVGRDTDRAAAVRAEPERGRSPTRCSAASPPLEPPDVRSGSYGLHVRPCGTDSVSYDHVYSGTVDFASTIAPAARTRATTVASSLGTLPSRASDPLRHGMPATASESLIVTGRPSKAARSPPARRASASFASLRTRSPSTAATALTRACAASRSSS